MVNIFKSCKTFHKPMCIPELCFAVKSYFENFEKLQVASPPLYFLLYDHVFDHKKQQLILYISFLLSCIT